MQATPSQANQTNSITPLALRLRAWGLDRVRKYVTGGQVDRTQALNSLKADKSYYMDEVNERTAAECWRKMSAIHGDRNRPEAETAYVVAAFVDDAVNAGVSQSYLDRAGTAWRLSGERFMPTFGQLQACAQTQRVESGMTRFRLLRDALSPPVVVANIEAPKQPIENPKPTSMDLEQTLAAIEKMEAELNANCIRRPGKLDREWGRFDQSALNALYKRRDNFKAEAA